MPDSKNPRPSDVAEVRIEFWKKHPARIRLNAPLHLLTDSGAGRFKLQLDTVCLFINGRNVSLAQFLARLKQERK